MRTNTKLKKIIVNATTLGFSGSSISYEQIVDLLKGNPNILYTITYRYDSSIVGVGGSLTRGQSTKVYNGMIINATHTNNA